MLAVKGYEGNWKAAWRMGMDKAASQLPRRPVHHPDHHPLDAQLVLRHDVMLLVRFIEFAQGTRHAHASPVA